MSTNADARRRIEVQLMEPKRKRIRVAVESSSEDEHVDEQEEINVIEENIAANEVVQQNDSDAENEELVEFKLGMTQKGGRALWYNG
jgi:nitrate reductase NapAB chaperone NapD